MIGKIYDVRLTDEAEEDLDGIYNYFASKRHEPGIGRKIYNQIVEKLESLEELPLRSCLVSQIPGLSSRALEKHGRSPSLCQQILRILFC